jgi:deazaflavin-dependent oxidoreductase (nitroreductase family)
MGRASGKPRTVELWFVAHQGKIYMVSGNPQQTHWVRNIQKNPAVRVRIENAVFDGFARVLSSTEQPLWDTVCEMAREKYDEPEPWGTPIEVTLSAMGKEP